ncbi:cytidine deaminase [Candidatus Saccharibacteria bacterium]|nr:MAG: cytidine deaminase [Candidatus Saccharibacteria bacterium]
MTQDNVFIAPLKKLAKASKAQLGGVACFVLKNGAIISSGLNHNPTGKPMEMLVDGKLVSRPEVVHAEVAAIQAATANGVDLADATLLLTMSPCIKCAQQIVKTDIARVHYLYEWWDKAGLDTLRAANVKVKKVRQEK